MWELLGVRRNCVYGQQQAFEGNWSVRLYPWSGEEGFMGICSGGLITGILQY